MLMTVLSNSRLLSSSSLYHLPSMWGCRRWSQEVLIVFNTAINEKREDKELAPFLPSSPSSSLLPSLLLLPPSLSCPPSSIYSIHRPALGSLEVGTQGLRMLTDQRGRQT